MTKVALFIPCYVDQFYPQVGMATVAVLEHFGVDHTFPAEQRAVVSQWPTAAVCLKRNLWLDGLSISSGVRLYCRPIRQLCLNGAGITMKSSLNTVTVATSRYGSERLS